MAKGDKTLISKVTTPYTATVVRHNTNENKFHEQHMNLGGPHGMRHEISKDDVLRKLTMAEEKHIHHKNVAKYVKEHELPYWDKK